MSTADLTARDVDAELLALAHALADADHPTKRTTSAWASAQLAQHDRVAADLNADFSSLRLGALRR